MKIPLSWLHEQIALKQTPEEISRMLTMAGLEVESLEKLTMPFSGVVVGRIRSVEKHPNADKLVVLRVDDGKAEQQVVCGATNCRVGMLVAWAQPGARVKELQIKVATLRGVESAGMLCSADELGFAGEYEGILALPGTFNEGADLATLFSDWLLDIAITPNLGHCASVRGIARELSAIAEVPYNTLLPSVKWKESGPSIDNQVAVTVLDRERCPRYACRLIRGLKVAESPQWLRHRLELCGVRSVNNVVDATNYVLFELGHPLHAFDFDKVQGREIVVRLAREGESLTTLDGKQRILNEDSLLICDDQVPLALAGVMGGLDSEVGANTVNVLLESAYFQPSAVRRSSKKLGLQSEGSRRFERGADPNAVLEALDRVTALICELAGGEVVPGVIDTHPEPFPHREMTCRVGRVNAILGHHLAVGEIENVFKRLGFPYTWDKREAFHVQVPSYRNDIQGEIDLIEEVARIYGYDNITRQRGYYHVSALRHAPIFLFERKVRTRLLASGLQELLTCDLIGPTLLKAVREGAADRDPGTVHLLNPISIEQSVLRQSLLPGLLQVVKFNIDRRNTDVSGFEVGRIHYRQEEQFREESTAALIMTGKERPGHWDRKPGQTDFFTMKGVVEDLLEGLGLVDVAFSKSELKSLHPGRQAEILVSSREVGILGEVHPEVLQRMGITQRVYFAELNLHKLFTVQRPQPRMEELPLYPGSERDWTVTLPTSLSLQAVLQPIHEAASPLLESVEVIDLYRGERVVEGCQNVTLRFTYRDRKKTLQQDAVDAEHERLTQTVLTALGGAAKSIGTIQSRENR